MNTNHECQENVSMLVMLNLFNVLVYQPALPELFIYSPYRRQARHDFGTGGLILLTCNRKFTSCFEVFLSICFIFYNLSQGTENPSLTEQKEKGKTNLLSKK